MNSCFAMSNIRSRLVESKIREMEAAARTNPDLINFGPGKPDETIFPVNDLSHILNDKLNNEGAYLLGYGPSQGEPVLQDALVKHMTTLSVHCSAKNILITNGAQQAIDLICQLFAEEYDSVGVQSESYPGAFQIFRARNVNMRDIDEIEINLPETKPKFLYAMTTYQNPTGKNMSLGERKALLNKARELNTFVIEDDPYRAISFSDTEPPLMALDSVSGSPEKSNSVYVGSFSKMISPGLRIGWIVAPEEVIKALTLLRQSSDLQSGTLSQYLIAEFLESNMASHQTKLSKMYKEKRDVMIQALEKWMTPYASWEKPEGGFFVWLTLNNPEIDTMQLLTKAMEAGVIYVPGCEFQCNNQSSSSLRLSFSSMSYERINTGIKILAEVTKQANNKEI